MRKSSLMAIAAGAAAISDGDIRKLFKVPKSRRGKIIAPKQPPPAKAEAKSKGKSASEYPNWYKANKSRIHRHEVQ